MNEKTTWRVAAVFGLMLGTAIAEPYDFYDLSRYPEGGKLKAGVELYTVKEPGGAPQEYQRREVQWWPRKGVDIIEVKQGMMEREWTWREKPTGRPATFKAHLLAFRGIGNTMSNKFRGDGDGGPIEPAVVLRLADGSKRCFPRGSFAAADKQFIMDMYVKEMTRIKAGLDKTPYVKPSSADSNFPNNAKPGEPGTMQVASDHFIWLSGSQGGEGNPWVNEKEPDNAAWFRKGSIECAESWWAMNEYAGHLMPYWDNKQQTKYAITVAGTTRDGHQVIPGYAGGGYGACVLKNAGGGPWSGGLFHEWGHGALGNGWRVGGGEAQADTHQCFAMPELKGNHHVTTPWRNIYNGSMGYGYTVFYSIMADDPNWGYGWYVALPSGAGEQSLMQIAARVGERRGMFKDGIRGFGDMMGEYGARLATFDCELEDMYRKAYLAPARSWLETVDRTAGVFRIPMEEAPEPYGVNIVQLVADEKAAEIAVDFNGLHDPDFYSDWRACIVALGADGKSRYSPLWSKGAMTMKRREGDISYWLTVAATPTAMYSDVGGKSSLVQEIYSGRHAYRYPWSVSLKGAQPGTPRECRADFRDVALRYKMNDAVPAPHDTPAGKAYLAAIKAFIKRPDNADDAKLNSGLQAEIAGMTDGQRHPRGGGWVAKTATVAKTAYIGPDAMVLGNAKVLDQAIVEDFAVVADHATVAGHARVSGQAVLSKNARADGYARTWEVLTADATEVPKRIGEEKPDENGLWANYAMDRDEKTMLTDWYRYAHDADKRYGMRLGVNLNGYLIGSPKFVVDGERRGFSFDGKTQYGELCPRVADLGAMTVDLALKWSGRGAQTILDLGSSANNCLVLRTDAAGNPELVAVVDGKVVARASARKVLTPGAWVRLRVESDGKTLSLWTDGVKAATQATSFRPCDAFPAGAAKRNFLATARGGSNRFAGIIDYVVFYHSVSGNFDKLPPPIRDAPTRPTKDFIAAIEKVSGGADAVNAKVQAGANKLNAGYSTLGAQKDARERELLARAPAVLKAEADVQALKKALEGRKDQAEFVKTPAGLNATRQLGQAEAALAKAREEALLSYMPEKLWMEGFQYQAFKGYYNTTYGRYLPIYVKALMGGGTEGVLRENINVLTSLQKSLDDGKGWHTTVDWEWRMKEELDGKIKDLPLMRKWLLRVRGK